MKKIRDYEVLTDWTTGNYGMFAKAKRDGKTYLIKRHHTAVEPLKNNALDEKTFLKNKEKFDKFVAERRSFNEALRSVAEAGAGLMIPIEEFVEEQYYYEVCELIEGVVSDEDKEAVLASMSSGAMKMLMMSAAGALAAIHKTGYVLGNVSYENISFVKKATGVYVANINDFDSCFPIGSTPETVNGSIAYLSPELGNLLNSAEDSDMPEKKITEKSDIFSLGLVFHKYLCSEYPTAKTLTERLQKRQDSGKPVYCWVMLNNGCELKLSDKITDPNMTALLKDMLAFAPEARPSSKEVLIRLK